VTIDWTQAPSWAHYHVFNRDGKGHWHEYQPLKSSLGWLQFGATTESFLTLPDGLDWREPLTQREE
jgi:hypothetical protein